MTLPKSRFVLAAGLQARAVQGAPAPAGAGLPATTGSRPGGSHRCGATFHGTEAGPILPDTCPDGRRPLEAVPHA